MSAGLFALFLVEHLGKVRVGVDDADPVGTRAHDARANDEAERLSSPRLSRTRSQVPSAGHEPIDVRRVEPFSPCVTTEVGSLEILQIAVAWSGTRLVMRLSGELDLSSAPQLSLALDEAAERTPSAVILNLELVTFMDAAGIRAILRGTELLGSRLILHRTPAFVMRLFTITGVEDRLTFRIGSDG